MKRFWTNAEIAPLDADTDGVAASWQILLDGKPVRVPGGAKLAAPGRALAAAVAGEWQRAGGRQGGDLSYDDLPLTRLVGTAQERIAPDPEPVVLELARYAESDLLCYRVEEPAALAERQHALWQPWLDWAAQRHGARLQTTTGIIHRPQPAEALAALAAAVAAQPPIALAALGIVVPSMGSLVLGLALAEGALDAETAHRLAQLDELFQAELWGHVDDAEERRERVAEDIAVAAKLLDLARSQGAA